MDIIGMIIDVALIVVGFLIAERTYKQDAEKGFMLMGKAFGIVTALGVAFTVAQIVGDGMLGVIDYSPSFTGIDILSFLAIGIVAVKAIETFGGEKINKKNES